MNDRNFNSAHIAVDCARKMNGPLDRVYSLYRHTNKIIAYFVQTYHNTDEL